MSVKPVHYCGACHVRIGPDDPITTIEGKVYHRHHARFHKPERVTVTADNKRFIIVPRGASLKDLIH